VTAGLFGHVAFVYFGGELEQVQSLRTASGRGFWPEVWERAILLPDFRAERILLRGHTFDAPGQRVIIYAESEAIARACWATRSGGSAI